ncbi:FecCD family ABC transporter permease [Cohnella fermenti]|uniref:Iron ABC transporter permease n=1 Tax=Cohnella fermenti TaxID=2565925 RepID=A0A4S4C3V7_9BACL|nr:iron ABC transporter permease [Cohnella fermenti]THF82203.1 iron ABC transporter permease [Cohnella fermenti]
MNASVDKRRRTTGFLLYMLAGCGLLILAAAMSISFGAANIGLPTVWGAIFHYNPAIMDHQLIQTFRFPRTVADIMVGSSLAVCGAIMQGTTRNALADSGLMGISSGAAFSIALCMAFLPDRTYSVTVLLACLGAGAATGLTYFIASLGKRGMTPQRLVLAGISISMMFEAFAQYISIRFRLGQSMAYWTAGGTAGAKWGELAIIAPFYAVGILTALALSPSIAVMSLGENVASGLGSNPRVIRGISTVVVLLLTGLAVIIVGPVGFVGLITPHIVRYLIGVNYRYVIPASAVYGALLMVLADLISRLINKPFETPVGVVFAVIGVPFFLYLVRKQRREFE